MERDTKISITVIRRLPKYHRYLSELMEKGINRISSQELSNLTGFTASQIRQDLNNFGGFGQQGYGYNVEDLHGELSKILGIEDAGIKVISLFDRNPKMIGLKIRDIEVRDIDTLEEFIIKNNVEIGIITVPKEGAQPIADRYVKAGIKGIWNFAPTDLIVPDNVIVENVRLSESIFILSYFLNNYKK